MKKRLLRLGRLLVGMLVCATLVGCFIRPYRFDLHQGNPITPEQIEQVEKGMTPEQVRYILGTPLLQDVFHPHQWDYLYYERPRKGAVIRRHLVVYFEGGRVSELTQDRLPD